MESVYLVRYFLDFFIELLGLFASRPVTGLSIWLLTT